jgi:hypothetical protein
VISEMTAEEKLDFRRNLRWWSFYILIQVICHICLSSIGAFFHFLLDHGISLVEGWLHNNGWELAVISKLFALWVVHRMLRIRLYNPRSLRNFVKGQGRWPDQRAIVVSIVLLGLMILMGAPAHQPQNGGYWSYHFVSYLASATWLISDYFAAAILQDIFPVSNPKAVRWRLLVYLLGFWISFRLVVPDYFGASLMMHLHFLVLLLMTGNHLQHLGNALAYVLLMAAPCAAIFGVDPIWGADFSPFKLVRIPSAPFLLLVWMLSLVYYRYRHRWRWRFPVS